MLITAFPEKDASRPPTADSQDSRSSDCDSGFGSSCFSGGYTSDGASIHSELEGYVYENGRQYHSYRSGKYLLPCDQREIERMEVYHHIWFVLLGGRLHIAPLVEPKRILDVGTGNGEWALNMAEQYPEAQVIGNDLSRIQPPWVPSNCTFEIDDAESSWIWPENHFSLIHLRGMSGSFSDWPLLLRRCYDHLEPGGYIEFHDHHGDLCLPSPSGLPSVQNPVYAPATGTPLCLWWSLVLSLGERNGRSFRIAANIESMLISAGFVDVVIEKAVWPLTRWPDNQELDDVGQWGMVGMIEGLESYGIAALTRLLGWKTEEAMALIREAGKELGRGEPRYWAPAYFVCARKPMDAE